MHRWSHRYRNKELYAMIGITKQGYYKRLKLLKKQQVLQTQILDSATRIRREHRRMGCRKMYHQIRPCGMGRDRVEALLLEHGFRVSRKRSYHKTTYPGKRRYENLISGRTITAKNQLWVSDITYIPMGYKRTYYLTLILDVYTKSITGWSLSETLTTQDTVLPSFTRAIAGLDLNQRKTLIFHSDRGSQYGSDLMEQRYREHKVTPSMGGKAWENAHAESLNGILKNEYINFKQTDISLNQARTLITKWVYLYNYESRYCSIKNMKRIVFDLFVDHIGYQIYPTT
jgi:putative transposase